MTAFADRAHAGLATIYRRWPTKQALVIAALHHRAPEPLPESDDPLADLQKMLPSRRYFRNKHLPARKFGKSWVVDLHDINRWIEDEKAKNSIYSAVRILTDDQAQQFFAGLERDADGNIICIDPEEEPG